MLVVINTHSLVRGGLCGKLHLRWTVALHQSSIDSQLAIRRELAIFAYIRRPVSRVPVRILPCVWYGKTTMVWLPEGSYVYSL